MLSQLVPTKVFANNTNSFVILNALLTSAQKAREKVTQFHIVVPLYIHIIHNS